LSVSATLAIPLALSSIGIHEMTMQNLPEMTESSRAEADHLDSSGDPRVQSQPVILCEFGPGECHDGLPRSGSFTNLRSICLMSPCSIWPVPGCERNSGTIPRRGGAGKPVRARLAGNRGMSRFAHLSRRTPSADPTRENIGLSAPRSQAIALMESKRERRIGSRRESMPEIPIRNNPRLIRVKKRSLRRLFAGLSEARMGLKSQETYG
jgi:hypothetical protein